MSDLHLGEATPRTLAAFASYVASTPADALVVLGDLFEAWVGDDVDDDGVETRVSRILLDASARGLAVAFMPGNRDFLVGDRFLARGRVTRLEDPTVVEAFGSRIVVSHGDLLCVGDRAYQRYRRIVRRPIVQRAFAALPRATRQALGRTARERSRSVPSAPPVDVDARAASAWLADAAAPRLVHGHTHAPAAHALDAERERWVLPDWDFDHAEPPRGDVLRWTVDGLARVPVFPT